MSFYMTDEIDITYYSINPETGVKVKTGEELNVPARVEMYNGMILSNTGREELASYLIMIKKFAITELTGITIKSVMGQPVTKKEYAIKKTLPLGSNSYAQSEVYV
jgi:hypothetical protein